MVFRIVLVSIFFSVAVPAAQAGTGALTCSVIRETDQVVLLQKTVPNGNLNGLVYTKVELDLPQYKLTAIGTLFGTALGIRTEMNEIGFSATTWEGRMLSTNIAIGKVTDPDYEVLHIICNF